MGPIYNDDDGRSDTSAEIDIGMVKVPLEEKTSTLTRSERFIYGREARVLLIFIFIPLQ